MDQGSFIESKISMEADSDWEICLVGDLIVWKGVGLVPIADCAAIEFGDVHIGWNATSLLPFSIMPICLCPWQPY